MWFYTADTVTRVTSTRRPHAAPRSTDTGSSTSHRLAGALRSIADRIDTTGPARHATDY